MSASSSSSSSGDEKTDVGDDAAAEAGRRAVRTARRPRSQRAEAGRRARTGPPLAHTEAPVPALYEPVTSLLGHADLGRVRMVPIGVRAFLGLIPGRRGVRLLRIGECVFVFAPAHSPPHALADFVSHLAAPIPGAANEDGAEPGAWATEAQWREAIRRLEQGLS